MHGIDELGDMIADPWRWWELAIIGAGMLVLVATVGACRHEPAPGFTGRHHFVWAGGDWRERRPLRPTH
jgi:hypothetical protein